MLVGHTSPRKIQPYLMLRSLVSRLRKLPPWIRNNAGHLKQHSILLRTVNSQKPCSRYLHLLTESLALAGIPMDTLRGSRTAVIATSFTDDYSAMQMKDPDTAPRQIATGTQPSILPNRISWYFDLRGPSVHIDTACSSSMVALDLACKIIRSGDATAVGYFAFLLLFPFSYSPSIEFLRS